MSREFPAAPKITRLLSFLQLAVIFLVHCWLVTYATGAFFEEELRGAAFDSLGQSLLRGSAEVSQDSIGWEGFQVGDKLYLYFGPFPALLRILPNILIPSGSGQWSRLSCLLAATLSTVAAHALFQRALDRNTRLADSLRPILLMALTFGFGLGTPLVYLVSCGRIYHEAIIWGVAGALIALVPIVGILERGSGEPLDFVVLALGAGVALLSRLPFGGPLYMIFTVLWLRQAWQWRRAAARPPRGVHGLLLAAVLATAACGFQLWYNNARWGAPFQFINFSGHYVQPETIGGTFNLKRLPDALRLYFAPAAEAFSSDRPFFQMVQIRYDKSDLFFEWKEEVFPLSVGSTWLLAGALAGLVFLWKLPFHAVAAALFTVQAVFISGFYYVTQRYSAEFLPLLVFLLAISISRIRFTRLPAGLTVFLSGAGCAATLLSTLHWNMVCNGDSPPAYKAWLGQSLSATPDPPAWDGDRVYLDLNSAKTVTFSFAPPARHLTWDGKLILFSGKWSPRGIGTHANTEIQFEVPEGAVFFEAFYGLPDSDRNNDRGSARFSVFAGNGQALFMSPVVRPREKPGFVRVALKGVRLLTLKVDDAGDGIDNDHGCWGDPAFLLPARVPRA